jgi:hypothetical protein
MQLWNDETIRHQRVDLRCTYDAGAAACVAGILPIACPYPDEAGWDRKARGGAWTATMGHHRKAWLSGWHAQKNDR